MKARLSVWGCIALLGLLVAIFVVEVGRGAVGSDRGLLALGALPDSGGLNGEYWRLLTFGFLHSGAVHLLLNGLLLILAGPAVERRAGPAWMALIFLGASVASGVGILVKHQLWPAGGVSVGASGGMFGLLGAALILAWRAPRASPLARFGVAGVLAGALAYSLLPGVSLIGHLVGLAVGASAALSKGPRRGEGGDQDARQGVAGRRR